MEIVTATKVAELVKELSETKKLLQQVEKDTKEWQEFTFKGEDGTEHTYSVSFGGITTRRGEWERELVKGVREYTMSFLKNRVADLEVELKKF